MALNWAIHRLNGISSPANAAYSADELQHQLTNSGATSLFTCLPLLPVALDAAAKAGIPMNRVYVCELPEQIIGGATTRHTFKTLGQLIKDGASLPALEPIRWEKGQGARQVAFLCYSSGTSGLPVSTTYPFLCTITTLPKTSQKGVMISHRNVIANTLQISAYERYGREARGKDFQDIVLGLLPLSHIYALIVVAHVSTFRGDQAVILPKFDLRQYLSAIAKFRIKTLYVVPPIIISMAKNKAILDQYDLSSVVIIFTGAAPLGRETAEDLQSQYPNWIVRQGYGLTETCTVVSSTPLREVWFGSSGSLISGTEAKIVTAEGNEVTAYDEPGELLVKSPAVVLGYLKNEVATRETFVEDIDGRWIRTGDEAVIRISPMGNEHLWITDRIKELIKVKVGPHALILKVAEHRD